MIVFMLCALPASLALDCLVAKDVGVECDKSAQRMFYYDSHYKVCQPFQYRGCGGNSNRFSTAQECREQCPNGGTSGTTTMSPVLAGSDAVFIPRGNSHDQWMKGRSEFRRIRSENKIKVKISYVSISAEKCGSNYLIPNAQYIRPNPSCPPNHSLENGVCCPTKDYVCSLRDDSGSFMDGIEDRPRYVYFYPRFAWNHAVKSCDRFSYFGANGNYNNFPSFYSCLNYCKDSTKIIL
ncbi:Kunitz/Bovine pancreatic trypsin inhibitor domain protein [Necator americanus]|uniref:Kunitz/Bovine pancreatic trypsin inhibitor domain protein n=1 Tax=Necator americanus TaxID=51031 RepID=W2SVH9_NECAM|nr:Kunitz/Bovine pancreatic trypsin inhibitor domain protein [Necator americanus]ETN72717.1 Kunitz/Bovine pancreatic trypsin inhibitor domain protein [Necator americanus]